MALTGRAVRPSVFQYTPNAAVVDCTCICSVASRVIGLSSDEEEKPNSSTPSWLPS